MGYKKDSRMGDEVFAIGAVLAPFAVRLTKQVYKKIAGQKDIDENLSEEQKQVIEKMNLKNSMNVCKYIAMFYSLIILFSVVQGNFSISHIVTFSLLIGVYLYRTKKYKEF